MGKNNIVTSAGTVKFNRLFYTGFTLHLSAAMILMSAGTGSPAFSSTRSPFIRSFSVRLSFFPPRTTVVSLSGGSPCNKGRNAHLCQTLCKRKSPRCLGCATQNSPANGLEVYPNLLPDNSCKGVGTPTGHTQFLCCIISDSM